MPRPRWDVHTPSACKRGQQHTESLQIVIAVVAVVAVSMVRLDWPLWVKAARCSQCLIPQASCRHGSCWRAPPT